MRDRSGSPGQSTDLAEVRSRLAEERRLAECQISALTAQLEEIIESSQFVSTDDEHDPDGSTVAFERSKVSAILSHSWGRLAEVDSSFERMQVGNYGFCEGCGRDSAGAAAGKAHRPVLRDVRLQKGRRAGSTGLTTRTPGKDS